MEKKTGNLLIRLSPDEKTAFETAASIAGISISSWVRERLRRACVRELEDTGLQVPFLREFTERKK